MKFRGSHCSWHNIHRIFRAVGRRVTSPLRFSFTIPVALFLLLSAAGDLLVAQNRPGIAWVAQGDADMPERYAAVTAMAIARDGDHVVAGSFRDSASIGGTRMYGTYDQFFIARSNGAGQWKWVRSGGGAGFDNATTVAVDAEGNSYVGGLFAFNSTPPIPVGTATVDSAGGFVAKYSPSGDLLWIRSFGTAITVTRLAVAPDGDVILTGGFTAARRMGPDSLVPQPRDSVYRNNLAFVARMTPDGTIEWARGAQQTGSGGINGIAFDPQGRILLTGGFNFYQSPRGPDSVFFGQRMPLALGIFVMRMQGNGTIDWLRPFISNFNSASGTGIACDKNGNIGIAALLGNWYYYYLAPLVLDSVRLVQHGAGDLVIALLDSNGRAQWGRIVGSHGVDLSKDLLMDNSGGLYLTGSVRGFVYIDSLTFYSGVASGLVARYHRDGRFDWAKFVHGDRRGACTLQAASIDSAGTVSIAGELYDSVWFDNRLHTSGLSDIRFGSDGFVARFGGAEQPRVRTWEPVVNGLGTNSYYGIWINSITRFAGGIVVGYGRNYNSSWPHSSNGVYFTGNHGDRWRLITYPKSSTEIDNMVVRHDTLYYAGGYFDAGVEYLTSQFWSRDPEYAPIETLFGLGDRLIGAKDDNLQLYLSDDGGQSWGRSQAPDVSRFRYYTMVGDENVAIAGSLNPDIGLLRSTDGGTTWQPSNTGLPSLEAPTLRYAPVRKVIAANGRFYVAQHSGSTLPGGIHTSLDSGRSWSPLTDGLPIMRSNAPQWFTGVNDLHAAHGALFAATEKGVLILQPGTSTWSSITDDLGEDTVRLVLTDDEYLYAVLQNMGVWRRRLNGLIASAPGEGGGMRATAVAARLMPNIVRDRATLRLHLPTAGTVAPEIVDALGRVLRRTPLVRLEAGDHEIPIDAAGLTPGYYRIRIDMPGGAVSVQMIVLR